MSKHLVGWAASALLVSGTQCSFAACRPPEYRIGTTLVDNPAEVALNISIPLQDFAPQRLICLVEALKKKYRGRDLNVAIFSSHKSAQRFVPLAVEIRAEDIYNDWKMHGYYVYQKEKGLDYLDLIPDGSRHGASSSFITHIDLPVTEGPVCKLAINGRCLLELQHIDSEIAFPFLAPKGLEGQVTVSGVVRADGIVANVGLVDAKSGNGEDRSRLAKWAMQNLRSWRFEPATHTHKIRLTYFFEVLDSPVKRDDGVKFQLPDRVTIRSSRAN